MAIDYSKWDKLEISDDSDVEVHPNVDKRSFIRWRQQDIHQKRIQRNNDIKTYEVQIPMYEELNKRTGKMLENLNDLQLGNSRLIKNYLNETFDSSKPAGVEDNAISFNEMIEDLLEQLKIELKNEEKDQDDGKLLRGKIAGHMKKIEDVLEQQKEKLKVLYKERELHISSEDIHTGFDRSFLNKGSSNPAPEVTATATTSTTTSKAPSNPSSASTESAGVNSAGTPSTLTSTSTSTANEATTGTTASTSSDELKRSKANYEDISDLESAHPDTLKFSKLSIRSSSDIVRFLKAHTHIITPKQKDALLMTAFDAELAGDSARTKQIVFLSTVLQYVLDVIKFKQPTSPYETEMIVEKLLGRVFSSTTNNPLLSNLYSEVDSTFAHIQARCKVLAKESEEEAQEIQLKSLDDNTKLIVNLPNPESKNPEDLKKLELFNSLPPEMQKALETEELDEVNKVFRGMSIDKAEAILEIFKEGEIIGLQAVLENENEFNNLKNQFEHENITSDNCDSGDDNNVEKNKGIQQSPEFEKLTINEEEDFVSSADIVD